MEDHCSPFSWGLCFEEGGIEELRHALLYTAMELETTMISAKEEMTRREYEVLCLKDLLSRAIKERDEAQAKCQRLMLDKLMLQQAHQQNQEPVAALTSLSDSESRGCSYSQKDFSSSGCDDGLIPSSQTDPVLQSPLSPELPEAAVKLAAEKPLPEKGKLLQAVIEAGPLLQSLLLAGPLPHWKHPPPQLDSIEIPPVAISPPPSFLPQNSCSNSNGSPCGKKGLLVSKVFSCSTPAPVRSSCQMVSGGSDSFPIA